MRAKLIRAIRNIASEAFIEINKGILIKADPSSSESFYFDGLGTPYNKIDRSSFIYLYKVNYMNSITKKRINRAYYRIKVGTIYILNKDDTIEKAKERLSKFIVNVV